MRYQSEELGKVVLAEATGAAIGQIGLDRLLPSGLRSLGVAGGAFEVFQNRPSRPRQSGVAIRPLALNRALKLLGVIAMALHPVPYYIVALILLIVFGYLWPILPISGGAAMNVVRGWNWSFMSSVAAHSVLPSLSLILIGLGGWFLGMRSLTSNIVTDDYVVYAEIAGVGRPRILLSYVMRNALAPQLTGLAMSLGGIFNGAVITEKVFGYPGMGTLLVDAVYAADYGLVLGVTTVSILGVSLGVLIIDLVYPLIDPRVQVR